MIKLAAFDWNGTLFADGTAIVKSVNVFLKYFKIKPITLNTYRKHFDIPVKKMYITLGINEKEFDVNSAKGAEIFHNDYEARVMHVRTRAHAKKLLAWLQNKKIPAVIFSNHLEDKIDLQLNRLGISKYFATILANNDKEVAYKGRVKEKRLRLYMSERKLKPHEVVVIGDTIEEIEIGKALGTVTIALTEGHCSTKRLKAAQPDFVISNLSQVIRIINKLNN